MNKMVKNVLVLTVITVIAGLLLGFVYDITKEPIQAQQEKIKQEAYLKVFPGAASFEEDESLHVSNSDAILTDAGYAEEIIDEALVAKDGAGQALGYVFTVTTMEGYGGAITLSMGVTNEGTLNGIEILSISETAGLGMKADTEEFKNQFAGKTVAQFSYSKTGAGTEYEIDALSGATITTNAMVNAVNAGLVYFQAVTGGVTYE